MSRPLRAPTAPRNRSRARSNGGSDNVRVTVEPGPTEDSRLFHFRAEFPSQGHTEGGFVMYVTPADQ